METTPETLYHELWTSRPKTWTYRYATNQPHQIMAYGDGEFVGVRYDRQKKCDTIVTSPDGIQSAGTHHQELPKGLYDIAYGNGILVGLAIGHDSYIKKRS